MAAFPTYAQNTPDPVPIPVDAATLDFSGIWTFSSANHTVQAAAVRDQ